MRTAPQVVEHPRGLTRSSGTSREGLAMKPTRKQDDPCSVADCERDLHARGLCKKHYQRMRRTGSLPEILRTTVEARFFAKVVRVPSGCWLWTAALTSGGYGAFRRPSGPTARAHVWAYESFVGPIPEGLELDHLCRVRSCVNPAHLEPVTQRENWIRGDAPSAKNARMTHCKRGHEFTAANGNRACRACKSIYAANYYLNRKATA